MKNNKKQLLIITLLILGCMPSTILSRIVGVARKYPLEGEVFAGPFSPDGSKVALKGQSGKPSQQNLYIRNASNGELLDTLKHDEPVNQAIWSPDGKAILVKTGRKVTLWNVSHLYLSLSK